MALDLTLCTVPRQIYFIISKALEDADYAELVSFVPTILYEQDFDDFNDTTRIQFKQDVQGLKTVYRASEPDYFYDKWRCSSMLDYLIDEYLLSQRLSFPPRFIWNSGNPVSPSIRGGQGAPVRLYDRAQIKAMYTLLAELQFSSLLPFFKHEAMVEEGVYKLNTSPESEIATEKAFLKIKALFRKAKNDDNLLIFKSID